MPLIFAIALGKLISSLTKLFHLGGGSAAPGLYALKVYPSLVEDLSRRIPKNIVITGTNGKTTTAKMIAHFAKAAGLKMIRNHTGSNLERGIGSALIQNSSIHLRGTKLKFDLGIWELDEAAFNSVVLKLKPEISVFLNVFRDQLDRYGEVDSVVKKWCQTLYEFNPNTCILVNGDDNNTAKLAKCFKGKVQKFGVKDYKIAGEAIENPKESGNLEFEAKNVKANGLNGSVFQIVFPAALSKTNSQFQIDLPLPGLYHIYDFLAAFAVGLNLGLKPEQMISSLKDYSPAFGRVEKLNLNPASHCDLASEAGYIFLIKNPAGATAVFETIAPFLKPSDALLLALNDNIADSKDVSWIWDAAFEKLKVKNQNIKVICSGTRAYDLTLRLKYAGIELNPENIEPNLEKAFQQARKNLAGSLFILPTYTAMLNLQSILVKFGLKKHYWKEPE